MGARGVLLAVGLIGTIGQAPDALAQPAGEKARADDPAWQTLDSAFVGGQVLVRGSIGAGAPVWFLLDTGSAATILDEAFADTADLKYAQPRPIGPKGAARAASDVPFRLGPVEYTARQVRVGTLDRRYSKFIGRTLCGVLGAPFFAQYVVRIEYAGTRVRVRPIVGFVYEDKGTILPMGVIGGLPVVLATATPVGGQPVGMLLLLDTGLSGALNVDSRWARLQGLPSSNQRTRKVWQHSSEEGSEGTVFRLGEVGLGTLVFKGVPTVSGDRPIYRTLGAAGVLGAEVLSRFTVTFDFMRQRVILEAGAGEAGPFESTLAGFGVRLEGEGFGVVRVDNVDKGSPGAEAGLLAGDILLSVGGKSTAEFGTVELGGMWRASMGKPVPIRVKRGDTTVELTLVPRVYE